MYRFGELDFDMADRRKRRRNVGASGRSTQGWPDVLRQTNCITLRAGGPLQALFPPNTWVPITLTNADTGDSVTVAFNRASGLWRVVP